MTGFSDTLKGFRFFLGSRSPRRQALLREIGIPYELWLKEEVPEIVPAGLGPNEAAIYLARLKAKPYCSELLDSDILITADTLVVLVNRVIGKPSDREDAISILTDLSGNPHDVITGVCLSMAEREAVFTSTTTVWFDDLDPSEIIEYVDKYQPFDKAGAYGIQEWIGYIGIRRIEGCYFNVMGLPIQQLYRELQRFIGYSTINTIK